MIPGECEHCEWETVAPSYPEVVRRYHRHLRRRHPDAWLRA